MTRQSSLLAGVGDRVSFGNIGVRGFGLAAASGDIWTQLTAPQQTWIMNTLVKLNELIVKATGTRCPSWGPSITAAGGCFQAWYNANYVPLNPQAQRLRTDGVFDENTLCALQLTAALNPADFPTQFPDPDKRFCQVAEGKKLSTGAMIGIGVGVAAVGGIVYVATRKARRRRR